jgi:two-component sensor histidine kinase
MAARSPAHPEVALNLALAMVASSEAPLLLLDGALQVVAASRSFCRAFLIEPEGVAGKSVFALGAGEWNSPRLRSLLSATAADLADIDAYEMDLERPGQPARRLVLKAQKLDYGAPDDVRLLLTVSDVTDARAAEALKDHLLREKAILLQEVQHRVANSLQIIASVLLQSARRVNSEETRGHLRDAHQRVMSVAAVQRQLAVTTLGEVELRAYFTALCGSISASMIHDPEQLTLAVVAAETWVGSEVSVSLGLIVTELVINALKHAFPDARPGRIEVGYAAEGQNWTLSVRDDGVGLPPNVGAGGGGGAGGGAGAPGPAPGPGPGPGPGLGTSIIDALARHLGAEVRFQRLTPGTAISIVHAGHA